jgi:hypothetical protein
MGQTLYLECTAGISGDMMAGALLDLGADEKYLLDTLKSIPVNGYKINISRVKKSGIDCCDFNVVLDDDHENHDHDMEYLHGAFYHHDHDHGDHSHHDHDHDHGDHSHHDHDHDHGDHSHHDHDHAHDDYNHGDHSHHDHDHNHNHGDHDHHEHTNLALIKNILEQSNITKNALNIACRIFDIIAEAEAKAHGIPAEQVHFHEVGAVDSIIDIAAVAVCLDNLAITEVIVPKLCEGTGTVRCRHGVLPVPVPATANIIEAYNINLELTEVKGEFVTPTGAAIVAATLTSCDLPKSFRIKKTGLGAGKRSYERPSILRAMLIESEDTRKKDTIVKLETNIDDCSGEVLGYVMEKLFDAGARDVYYQSVYMKKNRPAWQLNVICRNEDVSKLEQIIFDETTTIGIRRTEMERSILARKESRVSTSYGMVKVKICNYDGKRYIYPEYDSVVEIAQRNNVTFSEVYSAAASTGF